MTAAPPPSAPDRRAHEQQQLAEAIWQASPRDNHSGASQVAAALLAPDGAVTKLIAERVAEAKAEALEAFAEKWQRWLFEDALQTRGGAAYRARAEAAAVRAAAPQPTDRQEQDR